MFAPGRAWWLLIFLMCHVLGGAAPSLAQALSPYSVDASGNTGSPVDAIIPPLPPPRFVLGIQIGQARGLSDPLQLVYGKSILRPVLSGGYYLDAQGKRQLYLGVGFSKVEGVAHGMVSLVSSEEATQLTLFPVEVGMVRRYVGAFGSTVVPQLRGGLDCQIFEESLIDETSTESLPGSSISGGKWGAHLMLGLAIEIDGDNPAWTSEAGTGIRTTSILLEGGYRWVNNFGQGPLDLSSVQVSLGVQLEF